MHSSTRLNRSAHRSLVLVSSVALFAVSLSFAACSSDDDSSASDTTDSGTTQSDGSSSSIDSAAQPERDTGPTDPPPCTTLANDAPLVNATVLSQDMPTGTGGTIRPGKYFTTAVVYYLKGVDANGTDEKWKETYQISDTSLERVFERPPTDAVNGTATYTVSGNSIGITQTCPESASATATYTATEKELKFYDPKDRRVITLTKQ